MIPASADSRLLIIADHASNAVPTGIDLRVPPQLMHEHVALDIGAGAVAERLATRLGGHALLGHVSRLVIDLNREEEADGLIPAASDGHAIPGNVQLSAAERHRRISDYHRPYHEGIASLIDRDGIDFLVSIHSFTPALASRVESRPWPVGILYNRDDRAAVQAIALLRGRGIDCGDNQPYSGRILNYTMNRHAEANGLPYLGFEIRQDQLRTPDGIASWTEILSEAVADIRDRF